jgi:hypothetical protein
MSATSSSTSQSSSSHELRLLEGFGGRGGEQEPIDAIFALSRHGVEGHEVSSVANGDASVDRHSLGSYRDASDACRTIGASGDTNRVVPQDRSFLQNYSHKDEAFVRAHLGRCVENRARNLRTPPLVVFEQSEMRPLDPHCSRTLA